MTPEVARAKYPTLAAMFADGRLKDLTDWPALERDLRPRRPEAKARRNDPDTAKRAALAAVPRAGTTKARLLDAFAAADDGLTAYDAAELAEVVYVTASTRITELERDGMLRRTGRTRKTGNGKDADVLVLTVAGERAA